MRNAPPKSRLGLICFSVHQGGREVLDALLAREDLPERSVYCHQIGPGPDAESHVWQSRTAMSVWREPHWAEGGDLGLSVQAAVAAALDVRNWQRPDGGIGFLDVLVLARRDGPAEPVSHDLTVALHRARRSSQKVGRILLLLEGEFPAHGEAGVAGELTGLPVLNGEATSIFDPVVLLDRVNSEGLMTRASSADLVSELVAQLFFAELVEPLYQTLQENRGRLGEPGRFVSLGVHLWDLDPDRSRRAQAALLLERMGRVACLPAPAPGPQDESKDLDDLLAGAGSSNTGEPPDSEATARYRRGLQKAISAEARRHVEAASGSLAAEEALLAARCEWWKERLVRKTGAIHAFMPTFAPWYVGKKVARPPAPQRPAETEEKPSRVLKRKRMIAGVTATVAALGAGAVALLTPFVLIGAIVGGLGLLLALFLLLTMWEKVPPPRTVVVQTESPEAELRRRSASQRAVAQAAALTERGHEATRELLASIQGGALEPEEGAFDFPFTRSVAAALLRGSRLDPTDCWLSFLRAPEHDLEQLANGGVEAYLGHMRRHVTTCCESAPEVSWSTLLTGADAGSDEDRRWSDAIEQARILSTPWVRVPGRDSRHFTALPASIPTGLREELRRQLTDPRAAVKSEGSRLVILQLTQGFVEAGESTSDGGGE